VENFPKINKRAGLNKQAGWKITKKLIKEQEIGMNKWAGRDNELDTQLGSYKLYKYTKN